MAAARGSETEGEAGAAWGSVGLVAKEALESAEAKDLEAEDWGWVEVVAA